MTSKKTPVASPKEGPSTPPSSKGRKRMLNYLSTPEQQDSLPLSPGMKRSSSGQFRSPDRRSTSEIVSPYSAYNLLKTPRDAEYDSDEKNTPRRSKLMKTPQYFSVGKRLFAEETSPSRKDLGEISSQLKNRLSLAFDSLQRKSDVAPVKLEYPKEKELDRTLPNSKNINLITLQQLPNLGSSPVFHGFAKPESPLSKDQKFNIPSPDEESSAQSALLAAFSRAKERRMSHTERRRSSVGQSLSEGFLPLPPPKRPHTKLPSINTSGSKSGKSEQDAIYSLMSLSAAPKNSSESPQVHSSSLSRSSSVVLPTIPPISGLLNRDDDATDIEDATASEDE